ncbi:glycoside hydrolase family 38 N-terminal domain-containing protein [Citrobacter koseri]|nr:alpha-mannosidase [Citrobacter koseri]HEI8490359.1 alpha-mannosidase [Citrobacter koseri]HEM6874036.1 alpha-mannosidase [Citrobacter koseri]HEM8584158.1 alpha-mannosidase [Citrobacter koseri]
MSNIHVIAHTHWDQEWYFTLQDSNILASWNFADVIRTLEQNPAYTCYHFDGQTAVVEDFLAVNPQYCERLKQLVADRRLFIGPWYTQTDTYNVHGESIIRNLKYGILSARKLGHAMMVGYLPDTFGHNSQLPTLLRGCNLDNIVFWRGINHDTQVEKSQFIWQAPSGAQVIACAMPFGYGAAKNIRANDAHLHDKIFPIVNHIRQRSGLNDLLLPCGGDQVNIDPHLPEILRIASACSPEGDRFQISSLEAYIDRLRQQASGYDRWQGELKSPRYTRIHKTIGSVRYDIKKKNYDVEQFLLGKLEPTIALARYQGIEVNVQWVDQIWKNLLRNHAHDSIGGCNSDATNRDILHRLEQTEQLSHSLWNLVVKELATASCEEGDLFVINPSATAWSGIIKATLYSRTAGIELSHHARPLSFSVLERTQVSGGRTVQVTVQGEKEVELPPYYRWQVAIDAPALPPLGYTHIQVQESSRTAPAMRNCAESAIENNDYRLVLHAGSLSLHDKRNDRVISDLLTFEDCADAGDSYDFSPLEGDVPQRCHTFTLITCEKGPHIERMTLSATLMLPPSLAARAAQDVQPYPVRLVCELRQHDAQLFIDVSLENTVCDHRLRLLINSDIRTTESIASQPFAVIRRPVADAPADWRQHYREKPIDIETSEGIIAIEENNRSLIINSLGMKEFQICQNGTAQIALTLFKSTGVLGRDDLDWRPGRASGINNTVVNTPDAQLLKPLHFSLTLALADRAAPVTLRHLETRVTRQPFTWQNQTLNTLDNRLERFTLNFVSRSLPETFSLLTLPEPLMLSAIPHAHTVDGTIIRVFNAGEHPVPLPPSLRNIPQINYLEEPVADCATILPCSTCDFLFTHQERNEKV